LEATDAEGDCIVPQQSVGYHCQQQYPWPSTIYDALLTSTIYFLIDDSAAFPAAIDSCSAIAALASPLSVCPSVCMSVCLCLRLHTSVSTSASVQFFVRLCVRFLSLLISLSVPLCVQAYVHISTVEVT